MKGCNYKYCDVSNLYGLAILQKFPIKEFKWVKNLSEFNEDFIESYNNASNEGYFPEGDVKDLKMLHKPYNNLPFLPEIKKKTNKLKKNVVSFFHEKECIRYIKNLKQALILGLVLKKKFTRSINITKSLS